MDGLWSQHYSSEICSTAFPEMALSGQVSAFDNEAHATRSAGLRHSVVIEVFDG